MEVAELMYNALLKIVPSKCYVYVSDNITPADVHKFEKYQKGLLLVTPVTSTANTPCYAVIHIDYDKQLIQCSNTHGDVLNCDMFRYLCKMRYNDKGFVCIQHRFKCEQNHEFFVLFLGDVLSHNNYDSHIRDLYLDGKIVHKYANTNIYTSDVPNDETIIETYRPMLSPDYVEFEIPKDFEEAFFKTHPPIIITKKRTIQNYVRRMPPNERPVLKHSKNMSKSRGSRNR